MDLFKKIWGGASEKLANAQRTQEVQTWLQALDDAAKREEGWRKEAARVTSLYEQAEKHSKDDGATASRAFNILYANTETLAPAVYNNTPRPVVKRKTDKENPLAVAAALVLKKTLVYLSDTADRDYATFDDLMTSAVQEALVPGRGTARFEYDAEVHDEVVEFETVCGSQVPWNRVLYGYAKNWQDLPWMAYEHFMTREECVANFGERLGAEIKLTHEAKDDQEDDKNGPENAEGVKFAHIYEIWDKRTRKVLFVSEGYHKVIKSEDDPLRLDGFFNSPKPIMLLRRVSSLVPQTLYLMYETQAQELEDVTRRIGHLTRALQIRGFYDGTLEGLDQLLASPENTLLPARNVAALQQGMSLEKAIWLMPLENLITVLQQLYINRTQIIGVIQQLTGVADIMRGSSAASETLGAQEIKQAWGTMRLKRMQKEVQRFSRDCLRLKAELAAKHFSVETFRSMTGLPFLTGVEQVEAQQRLQMHMQAAQTGMQPPPGAQEEMQQLQQKLKAPTWEQIVDFLRNDKLRNYIIDIETNSTIDIEATEDKQELAEMMNSMGQLLNGTMPMVKEGVLPFDAAKALMLAVVSKFRMGDEVEETFRAMQQPQPKEDPAAAKAKAEAERDAQTHKMDMEARQAEVQAKQSLAQAEMTLKREELELQREELRMKMAYNRAKHEQDMRMLAVKATMPAAQPQGASNAGV